MGEWLMIGSSPSVLDTLPAFANFEGTVITCNSGIALWSVPDYYFVVDQIAGVNYAEQARHAQVNGSTLVTLKRDVRALQERNVEFYDLFLELGRNPTGTRQEYGSFRYTGPLCVEFACFNGAKTIHLVGFDGYRHNNDYFDPDTERRCDSRMDRATTHTVDHIKPKMRDLARTWDDVQFIQYGDPCFTVDSQNWAVKEAKTHEHEY